MQYSPNNPNTGNPNRLRNEIISLYVTNKRIFLETNDLKGENKWTLSNQFKNTLNTVKFCI